MNLHLTKSFHNKAAKLCKNNSQLRTAFKKQFALFQRNPQHPSLKFHKLKGQHSEQYAMWIVADLRALCIREKDVYIFFDLVKHDQY